MSTLTIDNLSHNSALDREAMDAIAGSGFFSSVGGWFKRRVSDAWNYVKRNPVTVIKFGISLFKRIF